MSTVLTSEIRKVTTLKFWWALALPPVFVGIGATAISSAVGKGMSDITGSEMNEVVLAGLFVALGAATLFGSVFSAINAGTEFRHDTITTSFLSARGRDRVIGAKVLVTALFALGYGLVVSILTLLCMLAFTAGDFTLNGDVFGYIAAGLFVVVMWSLIGSGLGLLFGSPTWPSIAIVAWFPVGELVVLGILSGLGLVGFWQIAPGSLTLSTVVAWNLDDGNGLAEWPWAPIGLALWAALIVVAGWLRTRERDIS
ncbi:MAG: ABC transporter permease [Rhodococcus fascians]